MKKSKFYKTQNVLSITLVLLTFIGTTFTSQASTFFQEAQEASYNQYKGNVTDSETNKALVFATLTVDGTNISTITNTEGEFLLKIPKSISEGNITVSFLGYKSTSFALSNLKKLNNKIKLNISITALSEVNISVPKDAERLVRETIKKRGDNYFDNPTVMTAFYRETIKKRKKNVSLSEAVVNIYKAPYTSHRKDAVQLFKVRKSTDYSKLDTVALKLQGGPFNTLFVDIMKYPDYIFSEETLNDYKFSFDHSTRINDRLIFVINFTQRSTIDQQLYSGKLFIDAEKKILTSAIYALNITNKEEAARLYVRKKPKHAKVYPTEVAYRVDYREKDGKWYYGYSNVLMEFKINWDNKLFNSVYSMSAEMAVTDWKINTTGEVPRLKERLRSSIILSDEAIGFSDPDFWGEYNIIEPEKSIESAIKKIQRQLKKEKIGGSVSKP